jgi:hypothetical protein
MNQKLKQAVLFVIALIGILLFTLGIIEAFKLANTTGKEAAISEFNKGYWSYIITSINGILTINLGVLLGVEIVTTRYNAMSLSNILKFENVQLIAAILFLLTLLITFLVWAIKYNFAENALMPTIIPQIAKTFFALILAVLGVVLAKKAQ